VENVCGAEEIGEMVKIPGLDWVLVGRYDMSGSTDRFCDVESPPVWNAVRKIFDTANAAGIPTGNAVVGVKNIEKALEMGCRLITLGEDTTLLIEVLDNALKAFQKAINEK
ncbi:MAG: aldolase/citrate lyase family protein, partial [Clostridiales bacterium]|nr:aldolase/citrate lyase family protein [Clostridiales bacterium]